MACRRCQRAITPINPCTTQRTDRGPATGQGFSSLFTYCTQALHLSEHAAYSRIEAARAARRFPIILDLLADGAVNLTTICLLGPHLTDRSHRGGDRLEYRTALSCAQRL